MSDEKAASLYMSSYIYNFPVFMNPVIMLSKWTINSMRFELTDKMTMSKLWMVGLAEKPYNVLYFPNGYEGHFFF